MESSTNPLKIDMSQSTKLRDRYEGKGETHIAAMTARYWKMVPKWNDIINSAYICSPMCCDACAITWKSRATEPSILIGCSMNCSSKLLILDPFLQFLENPCSSFRANERVFQSIETKPKQRSVAATRSLNASNSASAECKAPYTTK